jgi:hypothetical protein
MTRGRQLLVGAAIAAGLAAAAGLFFALFEPVEIEVETGLSGAARRDPLLAARRLLAALGVPAETHHRVVPAPDPSEAMLLVAPPGTLGTEEAALLLDWVDKGGDLIATPQRALLDAFGAEVDDTVSNDDDLEESGGVLAIDPGDGRAVRVEVAPWPRLLDPMDGADYASGPGERHVVLRYRRGQGTVTFLADATPLLNRAIGDHEHASFLWGLVTAAGRPAWVRVVWRIPREPLLAVLAERAWAALASGLVLLGAWAWRRSRRFGPLLPDPPPARRSLLEHVRASGDFLFRHGRAEALIEASRRAVQRTVAGRDPGWSGLPASEIRARLAGASGLSDDQVAAALEGSPPAEPGAFTRTIQTLEQMRKAR